MGEELKNNQVKELKELKEGLRTSKSSQGTRLKRGFNTEENQPRERKKELQSADRGKRQLLFTTVGVGDSEGRGGPI